MNKEQQIEEMVKLTCYYVDSKYERIKEGQFVYLFGSSLYQKGFKNASNNYGLANYLYEAGYRKIDENCAVITKDELKLYQRQAVKAFAERLKKDIRINNYGLEFVALVDIDAELKALLKEYE